MKKRPPAASIDITPYQTIDSIPSPLNYAEEEKNTDLATLLHKNGAKTGEELKAEGK